MGRRLAGFKVTLLGLDIPHDFGPELFEEEVPKVFPCGVVNALVVLALISRILDVFGEVLPCIYDLQMIIAIGVWLGIKNLVAGTDKLKVFPVCLAFVLQGLRGLLVALNAPGFLAQGTLAGVAGGAGLGMPWQLVNCRSTIGDFLAHLGQLKLSMLHLICKG